MKRALVLLSLLLCARASADGLVIRGNYYRDRNTRVIQPEAEVTKEGPGGWLVGAHYLLDTITSASVAAGANIDHPFTELRNEAGVSLGKRFGPSLISASYSYSTESDYRAQLWTLSGVVDLFHKNTSLGLSFAVGHDDAYQRMGPTTFIPVGALDTLHVIGSWTQTLLPTLLFSFEYDLGIVGFGTGDNGFQANPYRPAIVGGMPQREVVPFQRVRNSISGSFNLLFPTGLRLVPYLAFRPSYRFYWDDWGILSHTGELRSYLPIGPVELRVTGRGYTQGAASFWNDVDGAPAYVGNGGLPCSTCFLKSSRNNKFVTGDPKLGPFQTFYFELRLAIKLSPLRSLFKGRGAGLGHWISDGVVELSYGHLFNDNYAHTAWGEADLAAISFAFPL